jgi:hypothetical protein
MERIFNAIIGEQESRWYPLCTYMVTVGFLFLYLNKPVGKRYKHIRLKYYGLPYGRVRKSSVGGSLKGGVAELYTLNSSTLIRCPCYSDLKCWTRGRNQPKLLTYPSRH